MATPRSRAPLNAPASGIERVVDRPFFPPGGEALYRHIARETDLGPDQEFVVAPCRRGVTTEFLAALTGATGMGTDPDAAAVAAATERAREQADAGRLHFDAAPLDDLPYKDGIFHLALGEIGLAAAPEPGAAVRELARVTRPLGAVVLVQLAWTRRVEPARERLLVQHLGVRPFLLVEWKQMLREAGVVELRVEDWSHAADALLAPRTVLEGFGEGRPLAGSLWLFWRLLRELGWRRAREVIGWRQELRRLIVRERVLTLSLIQGTKWDGDARGHA